MRSLPPPRITRKRRWRRFKRAVKFFFSKGRFSDPTSYEYNNKGQSIGKITQLRFSSRLRRSRWTKSEQALKKGTNVGLKTASVMGRLATRSMPLIRLKSRNLLNVKVKF